MNREQNQREESQNLREESQNIRQAKESGMILQKLDDIQTDIQEFKGNNKEEHREIIIQTTTTNGKVAEIQKWRYLVSGGLIILNVIVWPLVLYYLKKDGL